MVKYPCSNCGEEADSVHGCPSCGRTPQQEVAALGLMITQMQLRYRDFTDERVLMGKRLQAAITRRTLLQNEVGAVPRRGVTGAVRRGTRPNQGGMRTPVRTYAKGANGSGPQNQAAAHPAGAENRRTTAAPIQRRSAGGPPPPPAGEHHAPETSTTSSQNVLLWLGALLLAVAAVVLTVFLEANLGAAAGELILVVFTGLALAAPRLFVRSRLTATAETIAAVAIVFVLLDGYNVWLAGWLDGTGISAAGYAGFVCLVSAGIAAVYRTTSHLVAPRFAAVLLVQPVMPLLGFSVIKGISAWATVISAVAAANLALALVLTGLRKHDDNLVARVAAGFRQPQLTRHTPYLLDAVWVLHAVGVVVGVVCAVVALGLANSTPRVLGGAAALLIAAVVGMGGGLLLRRGVLPDVGVALATLAVIGAFGRVAAVVAPGRGLLVTALAALATGWALYLMGVLGRSPSPTPAPVDQPPDGERAAVQGRRGARWAGLIAVVTVGVLVTLRGL
ncbi:MAG TPA: hypothetical protein VHA75_08775, partial [Rugosimonospora sp.]|nr:hypothetical protein [Rugosimonospora sp.]